MKQCPRCKELIGDTLEVCPVCKAEFTEKELDEMKKAAQGAEVQALIREHNMLKSFQKKRAILSFLLLGDLVFFFVAAIAVLSVEPLRNTAIIVGLAVVFVAVLVGAIIFGLVSGGANCPYCGRLLFRNYGTHCAGCGKKIH